MSAAGAGVGTGAIIYDMNNDFDEFLEFGDDDTLGANGGFPHDLGLAQDIHPKTFNPQLLQNPQAAPSTLGAIDLGAAESPDSINDSSFRDSSSDSGSSKRAGSASGKAALTNGDVHMMDASAATTAAASIHGGQRKDEWPPVFSQDDADANFLFGNTMASPTMDTRFLTDDNLFDYNALSNGNSPDGLHSAMAHSPAMPSFQAAPVPAPPRKTSSTPNRPKPKAKSQTKKKAATANKPYQQYPATTQQNANMNAMQMSGSREVSPMSQVMTSHQASPSAVFNNSPSPNHMDFAAQAAYANMQLNGPWANGIPPVDGLPGPFMNPSMITQELFRYLLAQHTAGNNPRFPSMLGPCKLVIHSTPPKSRVETQIPIRMTLTGVPPTIKRLHLPTYTVSKPKLLLKEPAEPAPDMLELYIQLVCTSAMQNEENKQRALNRARTAPHPRIGSEEELNEDPANLPHDDKPQNGGEVRICAGCITRERKRASRKKIKRWDEEEVWKKDEFRRVVVFNIGEVREWTAPAADDPTLPKDFVVPPGSLQVDAPMRISCYCRHHQEKLGFQVIFTIKDWQGNMVAQAMSPSIMITDDHKTHPAPPGTAPSLAPQNSGSHLSQPEADSSMMSLDDSNPVHPAPVPAFRTSQSSLDLQSMPRNQPTPAKTQGSVSGPASATMSRPASPSLGMGGPVTKKRKASGSRIPRDMTMTRLDTSSSPQMPQMPQPPPPAPISAATSPYAHSPNNFQSPDAMYAQAPPAANMQQQQQPFLGAMPTANGRDHGVFGNGNRSASMDNVSMAMFSAPTSAHPSRAPSPNTLRQGLPIAPQNSLAQTFAGQMPIMTAAPAQPQQAPPPPPCIHKIIPGEGPKMGGIEVTILGSNFTQGLVVYFGDVKATTTTYWGDSSLVCLLPPSSVGGVVPVTLKHMHSPNMPFTPTPNQVFRYLDDEEGQLTRMMLGMISQKMTGQLLDVKELAARIMGSADTDWSALGSAGSSSFGGNNYSTGTESQLLKCLELVDLDDSARMPRLDLQRTLTGQSMLHFGCFLGYHRFVGGLLARGANPDLRDYNGFTPMHMAALQNNEAIVRRLMQAGADPTIRSLSGCLPADLATAASVVAHIRRVEVHVRTRSRGSLHSRASSAASLRSFWEPQTAADHSGMSSSASSSGEESLEYSSGDFEDDNEEEMVDDWLDMRRARSHPLSSPVDRRGSFAPDGSDLPMEPNSPTAALAAAVREQVAAQLHQFQQAMQVHFPNFGQMPNLPQMPTLPRMLPNYQNYLEQSHFMDRMSSLMPNMTTSRPGSADDERQPKPEHAKWWDFSSLLNKDALPPPAYSELFPRGDDAFDQKQASAAQAAAEHMADEKCARLYDTPEVEVEEEVEEVGESSSSAQEPKELTIGRKEDITREQQQDFLRAHAEKFKGMRSDKNLWFIWIPLLTMILAAMLYNRFPEMFAMAYNFVHSVIPSRTPSPAVMNPQARVIEV